MKIIYARVISSFVLCSAALPVHAQEFVAPPPGADPGSFGPPEINQPNLSANPSISITPFSSTTQCGLSLYGNTRQTGSENTTEVGFIYNTNPCRNDTQVEEIRRQASLEQKQLDLTIQSNTECLRGRTQAVVAGQNPDLICSKPF